MGAARAHPPRGAEIVLALGLAAIAAAPVAWYFSGPPAEPGSAVSAQAALEALAQLKREAQRKSQQDPVARTPPAYCNFEPLIPAAGPADGHAQPEHPFPGGPRAKAEAFARAAEQAARARRPRDAEVALIAACRQGQLAWRAPTVPLARILSRLGEHYAAADADRLPLNEGLRARAREVLLASAEVYAKALGPLASRSRLARQRAMDFDQALADAPAAVPQPHDQEWEERAEAAPPGPLQRQQEDSQELRQLAADLARLQSQAQAVSDDPAGLRQRTQAALARRQQCKDEACLRAWSAARRRELLAEF